MLDGCTLWPQEVAREYVRAGVWESRSLADALEDAARQFPQRVFVCDAHGELTYAELERLGEGV
jgi:2,3-dihydroxybenzoate-AMP ligase